MSCTGYYNLVDKQCCTCSISTECYEMYIRTKNIKNTNFNTIQRCKCIGYYNLYNYLCLSCIYRELCHEIKHGIKKEV